VCCFTGKGGEGDVSEYEVGARLAECRFEKCKSASNLQQELNAARFRRALLRGLAQLVAL